MVDRLSRIVTGLARSTLGPAIVIWGFGYILVDIIAYLIGRSAPGLNFLSSVPMFVLGVCQTEAIEMIGARLQRAHMAARTLALLVAVLAATAIQALFDLYWLRYMSLTLFPAWQDWALEIGPQRLFTVGILYLWTFCLAMTLLWASRAYRDSEANAARAAFAEAAAAKAQSAALRLQLNPHFLFNTMNSISSLVALDRKDEAEEMISRLCDFLRASLNADPMEDVSLAQEIDTIDAYLSIEATRFGERLDIVIDVAADVTEAQVPNFILQPLVENAIKHGVSSVRGQAHLHIAAARDGDDLVLAVSNNMEAGDPSTRRRESTGIGLPNSRARLENRYGERARLETGAAEEGYRAVIRLPFVEG